VDSEALRRRISLGEDSATEFKSAAKANFRLDADTVAKEIAALANSGGGDLLIGVEDDGTVSGLGDAKQADQVQALVAQATQQNLHPPLWCALRKVALDGAVVLVVSVPGFHPQRPFRARHIYYVRDGSTARESTREELERILQSPSFHFDEQPVTGASLQELDLEAVDAFLYEAYSAAPGQETRNRYLKALNCVGGDEGSPTVAGILMFGRDPQQWLPDARVSAVRVAGTAFAGEFAARLEIPGRLGKQADDAVAFLQTNTPTPARIQGLDRREQGIPEAALREAILNALVHRDYRAASQVRVVVFADRVEIINPGILLNHLTLDSIRLGGISQRRNPVLAALLARARRRENLGFGVPEMLRLLRNHNFPEPEFEQAGGHFRLVIRFAASRT
jgi:ATP-dependent DNA helicase RecG